MDSINSHLQCPLGEDDADGDLDDRMADLNSVKDENLAVGLGSARLMVLRWLTSRARRRGF